jgi:hypothetical protein
METKIEMLRTTRDIPLYDILKNDRKKLVEYLTKTKTYKNIKKDLIDIENKYDHSNKKLEEKSGLSVVNKNYF